MFLTNAKLNAAVVGHFAVH